jgi:hypothetical protein
MTGLLTVAEISDKVPTLLQLLLAATFVATVTWSAAVIHRLLAVPVIIALLYVAITEVGDTTMRQAILRELGYGYYLVYLSPCLLAPAAGLLGALYIRRCLQQQSRRRQGECLRCGYNLTGNVSGICPECGTPVPGTGQPRVEHNATRERGTSTSRTPPRRGAGS